MAEGQLISEVVSQSAFDDLDKLTQKLETANKQITEAAKNAINLKVDVTGAASLSQLLNVTTQVDAAIDGLAQKSRSYVQNVKTLAQAATEASKQATEASKQETEATKQLNTETKTTILLKKEEERLTKLAEKQTEAIKKQTSEYAKLNEEYKKAAQTAKDMGALQIRLRNELGQGNANGIFSGFSATDLAAKKTQLEALTPTLKSSQEYAKKLSEQLYGIEIAVGQGQRKVGQYNEAARGLRDILRDTPAFAFSFATGIEAISNNIPQLTDGIKKMKEANKALVAAGEAPIPIWKTLMKEMLSFNGLISIATAVVTIFFARMSMGNHTMNEATKAVEKYKDAIKSIDESAYSSATAEISKMKVLSEIAKDNTKELHLRMDAISNLQDAYPDYFGSLTKEEILYGKVTESINKSTEAIIIKAKANAAMRKMEAAADVEYSLEIKEKEAAANLKKAEEEDKKVKFRGLAVTRVKMDVARGEYWKIVHERQLAEKEVAKFEAEVRKFAEGFVEHKDPEKEKKAPKDKSLLPYENDLAKEAMRLRIELLEKEREGQQQIIDNEKTTYEARIEARKKYYDISIMIAQAKQQELQTIAENTEREANRILGSGKSSKYDKDKAVLMLQKANLTSQLADAGFNNESEQAATNFQKGLQGDVKAEMAKKMAIIREADDQHKNWLVETYATELAMLHNSFNDKKISREQYNRDVKELEKKYSLEIVNIDIDTYEKQLTELKKHGDTTLAEQTRIQEAIINLKKKKSELENGNISKPVKDPFRDDIIGGAMHDLFKSLGASDEDAIDAAKKASSLIIDLGKQTSDAIKAMEDETYNRRMRDWDMQEKRLRKNADDEIRAINATTKYQITKANEISKINAQVQSAEAEIEAKKRNESIRHFNAQQVAARGEVIMSTALGVANVWKHYSYNPMLAGILTALVTGVGIAQMAKINSATPPAYKHGIKATPKSEYAYVGDGGEREWVQEPGKQGYWSDDKPELRFLPKGTSVTPLSKIVNYAQSNAGSYSYNYTNASNTQAFKQVGKSIESAIEKQTSDIAWIMGQKQNIIVELDSFSSKMNTL